MAVEYICIFANLSPALLQLLRAVWPSLAFKKIAVWQHRDRAGEGNVDDWKTRGVMWWVISLMKTIIIYWIELKLLSFQFLFTSFSAEIITSYFYYIIRKCQCHNFSSCFILFSLSLAVFLLLLYLLFPPPLPLSPFSLPFPFTSLPLFSLSHSKELSVSALPFISRFNMLAGGERGGCCALPSVRSCHPSGQRTLLLTPTQHQLSVVFAWRT